MIRPKRLVVKTPDLPFESEFWPEEGKPQFRAKTAHIVLRESPSREAPISQELEIPLAARLEYSAFRHRTVRSGIVVAHSSGKIHARSFGKTSYISRENYYDSYSHYRDYNYRKGDSFEYLQYRAEGTGFIRWNAEVLDAKLPWKWEGPDPGLELTSEPVTERWIQLLDQSQNPIGWLDVDEFAKEVDRTF